MIDAIQRESVRYIPVKGRPWVLFTDASDVGVGGALGQLHNDSVKFVHFKSKSFDSTQRNWPIVEREAYALLFCLESLEHYFLGEPVQVHTDNKVLTYIENANTPKLARWAARLSVYSPELVFVKGEDNGLADWLSRLPPEMETERECLPIYIHAASPDDGPELPSLPEFGTALRALSPAELPPGYWKDDLYFVLPGTFHLCRRPSAKRFSSSCTATTGVDT